jgi:hypothetical protein
MSLSLVNLLPNFPLGPRNWTTNYHIYYVTQYKQKKNSGIVVQLYDWGEGWGHTMAKEWNNITKNNIEQQQWKIIKKVKHHDD